MNDQEFAEHVQRSHEKRAALKGRTPDKVLWGYKDFLVGVQSMSTVEVGAYTLLLLHEVDKGSLPNDQAKLRRIARLPESQFADAWEVLSEKFREHEGKLYNVRMEHEFQYQADSTLSHRERASKGGKAQKRPKSDGEDPIF